MRTSWLKRWEKGRAVWDDFGKVILKFGFLIFGIYKTSGEYAKTWTAQIYSFLTFGIHTNKSSELPKSGMWQNITENRGPYTLLSKYKWWHKAHWEFDRLHHPNSIFYCPSQVDYLWEIQKIECHMEEAQNKNWFRKVQEQRHIKTKLGNLSWKLCFQNWAYVSNNLSKLMVKRRKRKPQHKNAFLSPQLPHRQD